MYITHPESTIVSHKNGNYSRCTPAQVKRYRDKISGPLLDRIDLHVQVATLPICDLQGRPEGERSALVRQRVTKLHASQITRQGKSNAQLNAKEITRFCVLEQAEKRLLATAMQRLNLSARAYDRILKVARTIADMDGSDALRKNHISEALSYRNLDRELA